MSEKAQGFKKHKNSQKKTKIHFFDPWATLKSDPIFLKENLFNQCICVQLMPS